MRPWPLVYGALKELERPSNYLFCEYCSRLVHTNGTRVAQYTMSSEAFRINVMNFIRRIVSIPLWQRIFHRLMTNRRVRRHMTALLNTRNTVQYRNINVRTVLPIGAATSYRL